MLVGRTALLIYKFNLSAFHITIKKSTPFIQDKLSKNAADRPTIDSEAVVAHAEENFRGTEPQCDNPSSIHLLLVLRIDKASKAKISYLNFPIVADEDVGSLDIPMYNILRV